MSWFVEYFFQVYQTEVLIFSLLIPNLIELGLLLFFIIYNRKNSFRPNLILLRKLRDNAAMAIYELKGGLFIPLLLAVEAVTLCWIFYSKEITIVISCVLFAVLLSILYYYSEFKK